MTSDTLHSISRYSESVDLRYYAASFNDKQKNSKLLQQALARRSSDESFFRIKMKPRPLNINACVEDYYMDSTCQNCFQNFDEAYVQNYYVNVLDICQLFFLRSSMKLNFKYLRLFISRNDYSIDVSDKIPENEELRNFIEEYERYERGNVSSEIMIADNVTFQRIISSVVEASRKFAYNLSSITLKFIGITMYALSSMFVKRLVISSAEIDGIRKARQKNLPIVYLLENSSRINWFIVLLTLLFTSLKTPVILLHRNVNSRWLKWIFKKCGVIFIRPPSLDVYSPTAEHRVCDEAWLIFVEELIRVKNHFILHLNTPAGDPDVCLLHILADSIRRHAAEDILMIPVIVSREKIVKVFPSEKWSIRSFYSKIMEIFFLSKWSLGAVKVNFFKPFSLKDLIYAAGGKEKDVLEMSLNDVYLLTPKIATHAKYDFSRLHPIMATQAISYLLLKKFRKKVHLNRLVSETRALICELRLERKRTGFTGNSVAVIKHALTVLGPEIVKLEKEEGEVFVVPVLQVPAVLEMADYAHETMMHFMMDALLCVSVSTLFPNQFLSGFKNVVELEFTFYELFNQAKRLRDILQYEYAFDKYCESFDVDLRLALLKYSNDDLIQKVQKLMTEEERWGHRFARHLEEFDDVDDYDSDHMESNRSSNSPIVRETDETYVLNLNEKNSMFERMVFYRDALKPYFDAYSTSAEHLRTLINKQVPDQYFYSTLTDKITMMLNENKLTYPETLCPNTLRNAIKLFAEWNVLKRYRVDDMEFVSLTKEFSEIEALENIVVRIKVL